MNEEVSEKIQEQVRKICADFINNLPEVINEKLDTHVCNMLGFDKGWGRKWETSSDSVVGKLVREAAIEEVKKHVARLLDEKTIKDVMTRCRHAVVREFEQQYSSVLRHQVRDMAEKQAKKVAQELSVDMNKITDINLQDIQDPDLKIDPLSELLLESLIKAEEAEDGKKV